MLKLESDSVDVNDSLVDCQAVLYSGEHELVAKVLKPVLGDCSAALHTTHVHSLRQTLSVALSSTTSVPCSLCFAGVGQQLGSFNQAMCLCRESG